MQPVPSFKLSSQTVIDGVALLNQTTSHVAFAVEFPLGPTISASAPSVRTFDATIAADTLTGSRNSLCNLDSTFSWQRIGHTVNVFPLNLTDLYEVFDTGQPEEALALALEHKPDAILLDLRMPGYSGFELCKTLTSFSATQLIPVFVISGEGGAKTKDFCRDLGAAAYFEKPVDFDALRDSLAQALQSRRLERRKEVRVALRVPLKLSGQDANGADFSLPSTVENVSKGGFLCACAVVLTIGSIVDVYMIGTEQEHVGKARVVRAEWAGTQHPRYGFAFTEMIGHWALQ